MIYPNVKLPNCPDLYGVTAGGLEQAVHMITRAVGCLHHQRHLIGFCLSLQGVCQNLPGVSPESKGGKEPRLATAPLMVGGQQILRNFCLVYLGITDVRELQSQFLNNGLALQNGPLVPAIDRRSCPSDLFQGCRHIQVILSHLPDAKTSSPSAGGRLRWGWPLPLGSGFRRNDDWRDVPVEATQAPLPRRRESTPPAPLDSCLRRPLRNLGRALTPSFPPPSGNLKSPSAKLRCVAKGRF